MKSKDKLLIKHTHQRLHKINETVNEKRTFAGYEFTVLKRFRHSVESVHLRLMEEIEGEK